MQDLLLTIPTVATLLEGVLLWRLWRRRLWSHYPYLSAFVLYAFVRDVSLFPVNLYRPEWFAGAYWATAAVFLLLQFFINWEFFRGVFFQRSAVQEIAWKALFIIGLGGFPAIILLSWSQALSLPAHYTHLSPAVEQYLNLMQALLLLGPLAVARYYGVPLGRNMRGLGLGFGLYVSSASINFASLQAFHGFAVYWRLISPFTFIGMILIWLWAFWTYAPSPEIEAATTQNQADRQRGSQMARL